MYNRLVQYLMNELMLKFYIHRKIIHIMFCQYISKSLYFSKDKKFLNNYL